MEIHGNPVKSQPRSHSHNVKAAGAIANAHAERGAKRTVSQPVIAGKSAR